MCNILFTNKMTSISDNLSVNDFVKVCRTCLAQGEMKYLYENCSGEDCLLEMLMAVTFVQFTEKDGLPYQICLNCEKEVIRAYNFAQKCSEVDKKLRNFLSKCHNKSQTETSSDNKNEPDTPADIQNQPENAEIHLKTDVEPEVNTTFEIIVVKPEVVLSPEDEHNYSSKQGLLNEDLTQDQSESVPQASDSDTKQGKVFKKPVKPKLKLLSPPYECRKCFKTFPTSKLLWLHWQQVKHPRKLRTTCKICSKSVQCSRLNLHMRTHSSEQPFSCDICAKRFNNPHNLNRHKMIHTGEKPHKCHICEKAFIQSTSLKDHIRRHTGETPFICDHCGKSFSTKGSLSYHLKNLGDEDKAENVPKKPGRPRNHHRDLSEKAFPPKHECAVCHRKFHTKPLLNQHKLIHGEKKFLCSHCGRGFYSKPALDSHLRVHTGAKPFSCETCDKKFSQLGSLKTHSLIHTGDKPYACTICNRRFTQSHHLIYHSRTHSGEKPHSCTVCGKSFALNGNLKVHIRTHTGETPYLCPICGKGFYDSSSMKKHKVGHSKRTNVNVAK